MGTCPVGVGRFFLKKLVTRYTELSTQALLFNKKNVKRRPGSPDVTFVFYTWCIKGKHPLNRSFLILSRWELGGALGRKGIY